MLKEYYAAKARGGSASTRSQTSAAGASSSYAPRKTSGTSGRPFKGQNSKAAVLFDRPSCAVTVFEGEKFLGAIGCAEDGSEKTIISPTLTKKTVLNGIGKIKAILPINLCVALKKGDIPQDFSFSRSWTVPKTVLHLSSDQLALKHVTFLVLDDDLANEDLLIGLPVLEHVKVDTRTLLEQNRAQFDGSDCSQVGNLTIDSSRGAVSRIMIARMNRGSKNPDNGPEDTVQPQRPRANF